MGLMSQDFLLNLALSNKEEKRVRRKYETCLADVFVPFVTYDVHFRS